jgi:hypothetical protein
MELVGPALCALPEVVEAASPLEEAARGIIEAILEHAA